MTYYIMLTLPRFTTTKRTAVLTFSDAKISDYAKISEQINRIYCERHGYTFVAAHSRRLDESYDVQWEKVALLQHTLALGVAGMAKHNVVVWFDADLAVHQQHIPVEAFVHGAPGADILVCHDGANMTDRATTAERDEWHNVNTGSLIVRNTKWTRAFVARWLADAGSFKKGSPLQDQDKFVDMLRKGEMDARAHVAVFSAKAFNSKGMADTQDTFAWHLMARDMDYRKARFGELLAKVEARAAADAAGKPASRPEPPPAAGSTDFAFASRGLASDDKDAPAPRLAIVSLFDDGIADYAAVSDAVNRLYAAERGYDYITVRSLLSTRDPQWDKVRAVEHVMRAEPRYEWLMWIDADAAFAKHDVRLLEDIAEKHAGTADLLICDDSPNYGSRPPAGEVYINTGTFLVRNNEWGREFMKAWWERPMGKENQLYHEQHVLNQLYNANFMGIQQHMKVLDATVMNSAFGDLPKGEDTFVVHMMKRSTADRKRRFQEILARVHGRPRARPIHTVELPASFYFAMAPPAAATADYWRLVAAVALAAAVTLVMYYVALRVRSGRLV